jgi:hypothetical protein
VAEQILAIFPDAGDGARAIRAFLRRAVGFMIDEGIDQFLDIGSGIPATYNLHEVAQARLTSARMVYVDIDPTAVAYGRRLLANDPSTAMFQGDLRDPRAILEHTDTQRLLDLGRPIGLVLSALLHFLPDDTEILAILEALRARMAPGSWLVMTHATTEGVPPEAVAKTVRLYESSTSPLRFRSSEHLHAMFDGFDLAEPGIVHTPLWRPEGAGDLMLDRPKLSLSLAGVARRRA